MSEAPPAEIAASSVFHFEASPSRNHDIEIYGTLPHRKKSRSTGTTPLKGDSNLPKPANQSFQDSTRPSVRRAEGFSRLLAFTRQQQEEMESCQLAGFDVTQSLPVYTNPELDDVQESEADSEDQNSASEQLEIDDEVCLLSTSTDAAAAMYRDETQGQCPLNSAENGLLEMRI